MTTLPLRLPWRQSLKPEIRLPTYQGRRQALRKAYGKGAGTRMAQAFARKAFTA